MAMRIDSVILNDLPPFAKQIVDFPPCAETGEVHLFVGENGTGKTRLLCLLAAACGNSSELDRRLLDKRPNAVVASDSKTVAISCSNTENAAVVYPIEQRSRAIEELFGSGIDRSGTAGIAVKGTVLRDNGRARMALAFQGSTKISDAKIQPLASVNLGDPKDHLLFRRTSDEDGLIGQCMANLVVRAGMYLAGRPDGTADRSVVVTRKINEVLTSVTGREFCFVLATSPDVRLRVSWGGQQMFLSQLPDGLRAIIGWLVACIAKIEAMSPENGESPLDQPVVLLLDEPESHLHPAWQRRVLPAAQLLLPKAQLFVATHSPFVISSVNQGWYYVMEADATGVVHVDAAKPCSQGDTYVDAVHEVLGLQEWYAPETESLLAEFRTLRDVGKRQPSEDNIDKVRKLADRIASRSESLRDMMARELRQFERQRENAQVRN